MSGDHEHTLTPEQVAEFGQKLYDEKLKAKLEKDHWGEYVVIEVDSGQTVIGESLIDILREAQQKFPGKLFHTVRIGFSGVFRMGTYAPRGRFYGPASARPFLA